ncbi:predicted protein [Naegleria gruberi]|uniref:Predicted protein n=1 Tax=Naegleria gruberi TaxID=5762 RepID=D2VJ79_NAEGR|nr:uncharacterized protein NAEGRDRAFT_68941 [Naegleria gruberi]EFC43233.1 predicted protein [Naegleria gruberi]|eukprot:XP_002675977.1 predicted protein [Naegleria gruberi strain NEG-M]
MNSKVSIHKYPNDHSTSQSSWTGGMVSFDTKQQPKSRKEGSDSVPYEYQPHQSKMKKTQPTIGTNYQTQPEPSSSNYRQDAGSSSSSRKPSSMKNTSRSQQQLVEDSPRSTSSLSSQNDYYEEEEISEVDSK